MKKFFKVLFGSFCVLIVLGFLLLVYYRWFFFYNPFWSGAVQRFDSGHTEVYLHEITDFEWDQVCVLPPYGLGIHGVEKYVPYDLGKLQEKIPTLNGDGLWAFAFIKDGVLTELKRKGRKPYFDTEFSKVNQNCISYQEAQFIRPSQYKHSGDYIVLVKGD